MLIYTTDIFNDIDPICSLDELKVIVKWYIDKYASSLREKATGYVSAQESSSWAIKAKEADDIMKWGTGTILAIEADTRWIPIMMIADRVLKNALAFKQLEWWIAGNAWRHKDKVSAMTDIESLYAYDWRDGWVK